MNKPFAASQFTPMQQWYTAQDKADFANAMIRFIESGFKQTLFTKKMYNHINSCFHHIAEYNQLGFYEVWFSDLPERVKWLRRVHSHTEFYGDPAWTRVNVERVLQAEIVKRGYLTKYEALLDAEVERHDLETLRLLREKYPEVKV